MIKLITTASDISKTDMLQKSLNKYGWDYEILVHKWEGFGCKILETYKYLKNNPDIKYFFYSDSYDTIVLDTMENTLSKIKDKDCILMSAERACYPHPEKEVRYPKHDSPWHFVNGGGWFCNSEIFKMAVETNPLTTYDVVKQDIKNYAPMVKQGGYLVIDDCCHKYQIPHGMFPGIETVSRAVDEWNQEGFKELFSVVHIRVFKKL